MLKEWQVFKNYENGGRVEASLKLQHQCPLCHFNQKVVRGIAYHSNPKEGRRQVFEELAKPVVCTECGVVMGLTAKNQEEITEKMGDKAPHES